MQIPVRFLHQEPRKRWPPLWELHPEKGGMWNTSKDLVTAYSDSAQEAGPMWSYRNQVTNTGRTRIEFMVGKKLHLPQESKISWLWGPGMYERKSICSKMLCLCLQGRRRWSSRVQQQRGTGLYSPGLIAPARWWWEGTRQDTTWQRWEHVSNYLQCSDEQNVTFLWAVILQKGIEISTKGMKKFWEKIIRCKIWGTLTT